MALRGMHPQDAQQIVKQESHRYMYGNGRTDTHTKHQNTNDTLGLQDVRLDTTHHSHLQHLPQYPQQQSPPTGNPRTRHTRIETDSTTTPRPSNSSPPRWATRQTLSFCDSSKTPSLPPSTIQPFVRIASEHTCINPDSSSPSYPY